MRSDVEEPRPRSWRSYPRWVLLLLVVSTVSWRSDVLYAGGVDPVVLAKGALSMTALAMAWAARTRCRHPRPMGTSYVWLLLALLAVSTFGAWAAGDLAVSGVLTVRLTILAGAVILLVKTFPADRLLRDLMAVLTAVALVGAVTGVPQYLGGGERLDGGVPAMHSNELASVSALPIIGLLFLVVRGRARAGHLVLLVTLLGVLWATGSRTSLLAVLFAFLVVLVQARRMKPLLATSLAAGVPLLVYLVASTDVVMGYFGRGGADNIATLNSRSIVWRAALTFPDNGWERWFGVGLSTNRIPVTAQHWADQNIDSSWVSALVQAGWLGVAVLAVWVVSLLLRTLRLPADSRPLLQGVLAVLLVISVPETGLLDASPAFLTLMLVSLLVDRRPMMWHLQPDRVRIPDRLPTPVARRVTAPNHGAPRTPPAAWSRPVAR